MSSSSPSPARDTAPTTAAGPVPGRAGRRRSSESAGRVDGAAAAEPSFEDGRITVCVRARPLSHREEKLSAAPLVAAGDGPVWPLSGGPNCLSFSEDGKTVMAFDGGVPPNYADLSREQLVALQQRRSHTFTFDHAYDSHVPQETVYADMGRPVLKSSFQGFNTCIFAYGQTGSGKSYCMMGPDGGRSAGDAPGIIPRLCADLFRQVEETKEANREEIERARQVLDGTAESRAHADAGGAGGAADAEAAPPSAAAVLPPELEVSVYVSYLEIYREKVRCLLNPRNDNLKVRQHPQLGVYVEGLKEVPVSHEDHIVKLMKAGTDSRHTASTNMNDTSSRSHAIFQVQLIQKRKSTTTDGAVKTTELRARINLVDLAGSERAKATGAEGETLKEGAQINKSLSTLGLVISTLAEISNNSGGGGGGSTRHVPYRDSTLTYLLKESLGGNSKTYMLSTLSPATINYDETLSTLRYADRAKQIVTRAFVNETASDKRIRELENEVTRLRDRIQAMLAKQEAKIGSAPALLPPSLAAPPALYPAVAADGEDGGSASHCERARSVASDTQQEDGERAHCSATPEAEPPSFLDVTRLAEKSISNSSGAAEAVDDDIHLDDDADEAEGRRFSGSVELEGDGGGEDSPSWSDAAFATASPTTAGGNTSRQEVEALQSELRRAEEVIRQLTATEREREKEAGEAVAAVRAHSTVRLRRRDPYLMNLDGLGDWMATHLVAQTVYLGAPGDLAALQEQEEAQQRTADAGSDDDGIVEDELEGDGDPTDPQQRQRRQLQYITVAVLAEDGDSIGCPHCRLSRGAGGRGHFVLVPCDGYDTFVNNDLIPMGDVYELQNGDVLTLGDADVGPQVKFMDPASAQHAPPPPQSPPPVHSQQQPLWTARGTRTRVGYGGGAASPRGNQAGAAASASASPPPVPAVAVGGGLVPMLNLPTQNCHADPSSAADNHDSSAASQVSLDNSSMFDRDGAPGEGHTLPLAGAALVPSLQLSGLVKKNDAPAGPNGVPQDRVTGTAGKASSMPARPTAMPQPVPSKDEDAERYFGGDGAASAATLAAGPSRFAKGSVVFANGGGGGVAKGRVVAASSASVGDGCTGQARFVGRHTLLFLGPSGAGKTHSRENLREPDKWYDFFAKRTPAPLRPTWGVDRCVIEVDASGNVAAGSAAAHAPAESGMSLALLELSGQSCFSLLQDQLPSRRVTYVLCFSLRQNPSLHLFRHTLEYVLCQSDHRDASVVLLGTHYDSANGSSGAVTVTQQQQRIHSLLDDLEQQVQNYFLLLQPNAELRPTIIGRFAVDNVARRVFSAGFTRVSTFPELLRWFSDQALQRCRNDLDFLNGRIPAACTEKLANMVKRLKNREGKWCVSATEYKVRAKSLDTCYHQAHTLHVHTQLLGHWGLLVHRFRHAKMKAHLVVDVQWYLRLLACVACCGAASADRPDQMLLCTHPIMHAYDTRALHFNPDRVILADAYGLLSRGVMTTKVLSVIVSGLLAADNPKPSTVSYAVKDRPDLPGIIELFQTCDYVVPGRKLCFSPEKTSHGRDGGDGVRGGGANTTDRERARRVTHAADVAAALKNVPPFFESFLLLPSTFHHPAPSTVVQHTARLLTGPFYRFTFSMVPPFFFSKLVCRIANDDANGCESVYVGPVQKWLVEVDGPHFPLFTGADDAGKGSGGNGGGSRPLQPKAAVVPGNQQFWVNTAWIVGAGGARAFLRMVQHSLFLAFNHTSSYNSKDAAFYADILSCVRSVVAESPGTQCTESILCCRPEDVAFGNGSTSTSFVLDNRDVSARSSSLALPETLLETDPKCFYRPVTENLNSLEKIREREAYALQTARGHRPILRSAASPEDDANMANDENEAAEEMPFVRCFSDTPLDVARVTALVDRTQPMRGAVKELLVQLLTLLADAREDCEDHPNDGSAASLQASQQVGRCLDSVVDALASMK